MKNKMKKHTIYLFLFLSLSNYIVSHAQSKAQSANTKTWTLTYIKSNPLQKARVKEFLEKNWFAMDSIAIAQGLISKYELIENRADETDPVSEWDFIVAVEYFTTGTYTDIAEKFEKIRKCHTTIPIDGFVLKDMAKIVKSETVRKREYVPNR